jgi:hypothetical protein
MQHPHDFDLALTGDVEKHILTKAAHDMHAHTRKLGPAKFSSTPRGKSSPACRRRPKDFPRIRCTSNLLNLVQLIGGKFASSVRLVVGELASGCTRRPNARRCGKQSLGLADSIHKPEGCIWIIVRDAARRLNHVTPRARTPGNPAAHPLRTSAFNASQ